MTDIVVVIGNPNPGGRTTRVGEAVAAAIAAGSGTDASVGTIELAEIAPGVSIEYDMRTAIRDADVIMMLRVQLERQHETNFPRGEYFSFYGLGLEHVGLANPDVFVMHPGPINRGREIASEVADSQQSVILNQVENGVAVRMAVLERILG